MTNFTKMLFALAGLIFLLALLVGVIFFLLRKILRPVLRPYRDIAGRMQALAGFPSRFSLEGTTAHPSTEDLSAARWLLSGGSFAEAAVAPRPSSPLLSQRNALLDNSAVLLGAIAALRQRPDAADVPVLVGVLSGKPQFGESAVRAAAAALVDSHPARAGAALAKSSGNTIDSFLSSASTMVSPALVDPLLAMAHSVASHQNRIYDHGSRWPRLYGLLATVLKHHASDLTTAELQRLSELPLITERGVPPIYDVGPGGSDWGVIGTGTADRILGEEIRAGAERTLATRA